MFTRSACCRIELHFCTSGPLVSESTGFWWLTHAWDISTFCSTTLNSWVKTPPVHFVDQMRRQRSNTVMSSCFYSCSVWIMLEKSPKLCLFLDKLVSIIKFCLPQSLFSAIIQNPAGNSRLLFVEGTRGLPAQPHHHHPCSTLLIKKS